MNLNCWNFCRHVGSIFIDFLLYFDVFLVDDDDSYSTWSFFSLFFCCRRKKGKTLFVLARSCSFLLNCVINKIKLFHVFSLISAGSIQDDEVWLKEMKLFFAPKLDSITRSPFHFFLFHFTRVGKIPTHFSFSSLHFQWRKNSSSIIKTCETEGLTDCGAPKQQKTIFSINYIFFPWHLLEATHK